MDNCKQFFLCMIVFLNCQIILRAAESNSPVDQLAEQVSTIDFEKISDSRKVYYLLSLTKSFDKIERSDLAEEFFNLARQISNSHEKHAYHYSLFNYADQKDDLQLAEEIAENAIQNKDSMLDRLDLMRYRLGDQDAIANYPRQKQTFYNAMDLARTYIKLGEYEKAENYVTGIKISEENDPLSVTGLTLNYIADSYHEAGKNELALKYIDKARTIAGNLFYTGYCIEIDHRSMHGTLTNNLEQFAERGQAYQAGMARDLVSNLIRELIDSGELEAAKKAIKYLDEQKYRDRYMKAIAVAMAKNGKPGEAFASINQIHHDTEKRLAQIELAAAFWEVGEKDSVENLIKFASAKLADKTFSDAESSYLALANLYAQMNQFEKVEQILKLAQEELHRLKLIDKAVAGFVTMQLKAK